MEVEQMPNEEISNIFTQNLKKLLEENNMTAKDLAEKLEFRASTVSMWLTGKNSPRMDLLDKIADLFNIPVSILLTGKSNIAERGLAVLSDIRSNALAAHFEGEDFTNEELKEIENFIEFVKSKRKDKNNI